MAKTVITGTFLKLATVEYAAQIKGVTLKYTAASQDVTNMASGGATEVIGGIKSGSLALELVKDSDMSGLDAAMWTAIGTLIAFEMARTNAAASDANPHFTGYILITEWDPIAGAVGAVFAGSHTYPTSGAITRVVA